ncbi:MAG: T9SS type A sorting domain-containing protein [Chitinophagaceae bacterium]|nr:T9SS type A sorting domain-containing protein [Chitinophagaceae bacterium]
MKKYIVTIMLALASFQVVFAQCAYLPQAGTVPIQQNVSLLNNGNVNPLASFIVCQDVHLTLTPIGTQVLNIYLEPYAQLTINHDSTFFAEINVYAKEQSIIDFGMPNQINMCYIHDLVYDSTTTIIDSTGNVGNTGIIQECPTFVSFSYSNFPGGISPCLFIPNAVTTVNKELNFQLVNPFQHDIIITTKKTLNKALFKLFSCTGEITIEKELMQSSTQIDAEKLPEGLYFYQIIEGGLVSQSGKLLHQSY